VGIKGTHFSLGYDPNTQISTVIVLEGTVWITPLNASLQPFTLTLGQEVEVGISYAGPVKQINIPNTTAGINGTWTLQDNKGGQLVQVFQNGNSVSWQYRGGRGHENMAGTVKGTFDGKYFTGTFTVREGSVTANGTMNLVLNADRLEGTWVSTTAAGQSGNYVLTRGNKQSMQIDNILVGKWTWAYAPPGQELQVHNIVIFNSDGTFTSNQGSGKWVLSGDHVTIYWPASTDDLTLSADGNTLAGKNKDGWNVRGTRQSTQIDNALVGKWTWAYAPPGQELQVHNIVIFNSDGTFTSNQGSGKWILSGNHVAMYWPASTDDLTLSADGNTLAGQNKDGWNVRGTRQ
jgi:hypothetical protein